MKKYYSIFIATILLLLAACVDTTNKGNEVNQNYSASDSAVGNSAAANTIYRDSSDISNATESGGGTGNPSNKTEDEGSDTIHR